MSIGLAAGLGVQPAANANVVTSDEITIVAGGTATVQGVLSTTSLSFFGLWFRQTAGANTTLITPQFVWNISPITNDLSWENVVDPFAGPALGLVSSTQYRIPALGYRVVFGAPGANAVTIRYQIAAWGM